MRARIGQAKQVVCAAVEVEPRLLEGQRGRGEVAIRPGWDALQLGDNTYLGGLATHDGIVVMNVTHRLEDGHSEVGIWIGPSD